MEATKKSYLDGLTKSIKLSVYQHVQRRPSHTDLLYRITFIDENQKQALFPSQMLPLESAKLTGSLFLFINSNISNDNQDLFIHSFSHLNVHKIKSTQILLYFKQIVVKSDIICEPACKLPVGAAGRLLTSLFGSFQANNGNVRERKGKKPNKIDRSLGFSADKGIRPGKCQET